MPKVRRKKVSNRKDKRPYFQRNGKPYAICSVCGKTVEGKEEQKIGGSREGTVLIFQCKCGKRWPKDSMKFKQAITGGYSNLFGKRIRCDEYGYSEKNPKKITTRGY